MMVYKMRCCLVVGQTQSRYFYTVLFELFEVVVGCEWVDGHKTLFTTYIINNYWILKCLYSVFHCVRNTIKKQKPHAQMINLCEFTKNGSRDLRECVSSGWLISFVFKYDRVIV